MEVPTLDILLVQDQKFDVELFLMALKSNESAMTTHVAVDGCQAVDFLLNGDCKAKGYLPRLVLLDMNMPCLNGLEVLQRIRADEFARPVPIVIFSASGEKSDQAEAMKLGANGYIQKPVGFRDLCVTVAQIERDWLSLPSATDETS